MKCSLKAQPTSKKQTAVAGKAQTLGPDCLSARAGTLGMFPEVAEPNTLKYKIKMVIIHIS